MKQPLSHKVFYERSGPSKMLFVVWMSIAVFQAKRHYRHDRIFVKRYFLFLPLDCSFGGVIFNTPLSSLYRLYCASLICPSAS